MGKKCYRRRGNTCSRRNHCK